MRLTSIVSLHRTCQGGNTTKEILLWGATSFLRVYSPRKACWTCTQLQVMCERTYFRPWIRGSGNGCSFLATPSGEAGKVPCACVRPQFSGRQDGSLRDDE